MKNTFENLVQHSPRKAFPLNENNFAVIIKLCEKLFRVNLIY